MKISKCVIIAVFTFIFGATIGWIAQGRFLSILFTSYVPALAALATILAAYFGAKYAFDCQNNKETENTKRKNILNGNVVIFNISRMINYLLGFQKQVIDTVRTKPNAFLIMPPTILISKEDISVDLSSIYYILDTEDINLLGELSTELSKYIKTLDVINERSRIHIREVQPILKKAGIVHDGDYSLEQIKAVLGDRLYVTMQGGTKQVIEYVDNTLLSLQEVGSKLTQSLKKQFPDEAIISVSIPEQEEIIKLVV